MGMFMRKYGYKLGIHVVSIEPRLHRLVRRVISAAESMFILVLFLTAVVGSRPVQCWSHFVLARCQI